MKKCFLVQNIGDTPGRYSPISDELADAINSFEKTYFRLHSQYSGVQLLKYMQNFPGRDYQERSLKEILSANTFEKLLNYCKTHNYKNAIVELSDM